MFKDKKDKNKKNYQSFDSWVSNLKKSANEFIEEIEKEIEEEEEKKKEKSYEESGKATVFRKFSDSKDVKEIFPRNNKQKQDKKTSGMDQRSHEGKVNSKGSIKKEGQMGREGDPINPDLRKRLEEKRRKELHRKREEASTNDKSYKRKSVKRAEKHEKIDRLRSEFKDKDQIRKAVILSEILAPPLSKRKNH